MEKIIADLNPMLRGGFGYFKHAYRTEFKSVDGFVRRRLQALLLRRNKKIRQGQEPPGEQTLAKRLFREAWTFHRGYRESIEKWQSSRDCHSCRRFIFRGGEPLH